METRKVLIKKLTLAGTWSSVLLLARLCEALQEIPDTTIHPPLGNPWNWFVVIARSWGDCWRVRDACCSYMKLEFFITLIRQLTTAYNPGSRASDTSLASAGVYTQTHRHTHMHTHACMYNYLIKNGHLSKDSLVKCHTFVQFSCIGLAHYIWHRSPQNWLQTWTW